MQNVKEYTSMDFKDNYVKWIESDAVDSAVKDELNNIAGNEKETEDRFYKDFAFGIRFVI